MKTLFVTHNEAGAAMLRKLVSLAGGDPDTFAVAPPSAIPSIMFDLIVMPYDRGDARQDHDNGRKREATERWVRESVLVRLAPDGLVLRL